MSPATAETSSGTAGALSQGQLIRRRFARHRLAVASLHLLGMLYLLAVFADFFAPYGRTWHNLDYAYCPPMPVRFDLTRGFHTPLVRLREDPVTLRKYYVRDEGVQVPLGFFVAGAPHRLLGLIDCDRHFFGVDPGRWRQTHDARDDEAVQPAFLLLGSDAYGQDILSRILFGSRISLSIGLVSIVFTFVLGLTLGGISGYVGGTTDTAIQRLIELVNAFPQLPLWLAIAAALPGDWPPLRVYLCITIVLSLLNWTGLARVVRGKILSLREEDYAIAARLLGASHQRILVRHLLPGFTSHIIVTLTLSIPAMILGETALSFLGLGLRPPIVSWGVMLQDCLNLQVVVNYPWLLSPVAFIVLTVLGFNFLGDGLRDAADPYSSR